MRLALERDEHKVNGTRSQRLYLELGEGEPLMVCSRRDRVGFTCYIRDSGCSEEHGVEKELLVMTRLLWFCRRK